MLPIPDFGRWWAALLFGLMLLFLLLIARGCCGSSCRSLRPSTWALFRCHRLLRPLACPIRCWRSRRRSTTC